MKIKRTACLSAVLFLPAIWGCTEDPVAPDGLQSGVPASAFTVDPHLSITPGAMTLGIGEEGQFSAVLFPYHATTSTPQNLHWISMDPAIASVDAQGIVHGLSRGMARIRADADGFMDDAWVRVH